MPDTVHEIFEETARVHAARPAMRRKREGGWETITWSEYRRTVRRAAAGFASLGVERGAGVVIMGFNRPEWFVAQLAVMAAGGVPAGIYTTSTAEQCRYIAAHAEAAVAVVESREYLERFVSVRRDLPRLRAIVLMEGEAGGEALTWTRLLEAGDAGDGSEIERRMAATKPEDVCTLIYTSGTTGSPKAVMLTHRNVSWIARRAVERHRRARRRPAHQLPAALPHRRAGGVALPLHGHGGLRPLRAEHREARRRPARGPSPRLPGGSPGVGEDPGRRPGRGRAVEGPQEADCGVGARRRSRRRLRGPAGPPPAVDLPPRRAAGLLQGAGEARSRRRALRDRVRRAHRRRDARVLPEPRPPHHGGLRDERVHRPDDDVAARRLPHRACRARDPGHRAATRRGRRGPDARPPRFRGLLQERRGDPRG